MASAGVGPLLAGSMGEAHHLSHSERLTLIKSARRALDGASLSEVPLIVGTGAGSTRETVELSKAAAAAGADYAIVITSGYFAGALIPSRKALKAFFTEVAEKSPIPVMIYNCAYPYVFPLSSFFYPMYEDCASPFIPYFLRCRTAISHPSSLSADPGASGGIDLDSDLITELADLPNICGVKLTYAPPSITRRLPRSYVNPAAATWAS